MWSFFIRLGSGSGKRGRWNSGVHSESTCRKSGSGSWARNVLTLNTAGWKKCWRLARKTPLQIRTCCVSVSLAHVSVSFGFEFLLRVWGHPELQVLVFVCVVYMVMWNTLVWRHARLRGRAHAHVVSRDQIEGWCPVETVEYLIQ